MVAACVSFFEVHPGLQEEFRSVLRQHSAWLEQRLRGLDAVMWAATLQYAGARSGLVSLHVAFPTSTARAGALDDVLVRTDSPLSAAIESPAAPARRAGQALYRSLDPAEAMIGPGYPLVAILGVQPLPGRRDEAITALRDARWRATADALGLDVEMRLFEFEESGEDWGRIVIATAVRSMADYDRLRRAAYDDGEPAARAVEAGVITAVNSAILATYRIARP